MIIKKTVRKLTLILIAMAVLAGCNIGNQTEDEPEAIAVTGVILDHETLALTVHDSFHLAAAITPENASNQNISWSSDANTIASVDQNGLVTALAEGTATITVTSEDGEHTDSCEVTVTTDPVPATGVTLNRDTLALSVNDTCQLTASIIPDNAGNKAVSWRSSASAVAAVNENGYVTALSEGSVTITVTTEDGGHTDSCVVTINPVLATGVTLNRETFTLSVGGIYQLTASMTPDNASNKTVIWNSNASAVATVNQSGLITGIAEGTATITVTTEDGGHTDSCVVMVTTDSVPVTGVTLNRETLTLSVSGTSQLTASITPDNASNKTVSWSSDTGSVAEVDENGLVTGIAEGTATITVITEDGSNTDSCTVTVQSGTGYIIANHEVVEQYTEIPQEYIDIIKTWLVDAGGESHSEGYRTGVASTHGVGSIDSRFAATTFTWGLPAATNQALRLGTHATVGEGDFWTNDTAKNTIKDLIRQQHEADNPIHVIFQAWCGDLIRARGPAGAGTGDYDPVYGCHWLGSSVGGPDGDHIWGLDADDFAITGNRISLQNYLDTIDEYNEYCRDNGYVTTAIFSTGPVDGGSASDEAGYQRYVKHERIREYVAESQTRILFDYADILSYNDDGERHLETWTSPYTGETYTFPAIHPDNDPDETGHISYAGALRIGKAMWWLLARMAGWDGGL